MRKRTNHPKNRRHVQARHRNSYGIYYADSVVNLPDQSNGNRIAINVVGLDSSDNLTTYSIPVSDTDHWKRIAKSYWSIDDLNELANRWQPMFIRCCRFIRNGKMNILPVLPDRAVKLINMIHRGPVAQSDRARDF